jgi:F-type H+-transporting ATPase subunit gamma
MTSVKELRQRIKSVGSIKQITRAMEMVATTKLRRFQDRATASRPYTLEISGLVGRLAAVIGEDVRGAPLFQQREGKRTLALVVSSDRGLCGAYNSNVGRALETWRAEHADREVEYFVYGRKGNAYLLKRGFRVASYLSEPPLEAVDYKTARATARALVQAFLEGDCDEVWLLYTAFESLAKYVPTWVRFLPIEAGSLGHAETTRSMADVLLEPSPRAVFDAIVPRYLETRVYNALIESLTSEYASRRFAMKNATDAATDMQQVLKGMYNRKRQETITKELLDIVGGAEAVS